MSLWSRIERRIGEIAGDILPDDHRAAIDRARELIDRGDRAAAFEAIAALEPVVAARADHAGAWSLLGAARLLVGAPADALGAFDRALAVYDDLAAAHVGRGEARLALADPEAARVNFRAALAHARGDANVLAAAYRGLGDAYRASGRLDKAARELRKAVAEAPDDAGAALALGEVLAAAGADDDEARGYLVRATRAAGAPDRVWLVLGRLDLVAGRFGDAAASFEKAISLARDHASGPEAEAEALAAQADLALARHDPVAAHDGYLRALALRPRRADLHARMGDAHRAIGNLDAALGCYARACELGAGAEVARRGVAAALALGDPARAVPLANQVLAARADDPHALTARGIVLAADGNLDAARATYRAALAAGDDVEPHLALAALELMAAGPDAGGRAAAEAWAALRLAPREPRARTLLARAREQELEVGRAADRPAGDDGAYRLLGELERLLLTRPELADLVPALAAATADLDRPLLVTVMGEFSSGKSSFVNALLGEDVAPVGVTPTTATINVVKHGRERAGRFLGVNGTVTPLTWEELGARLRGLDAEQARAIRMVEILYPLDSLERVQIVDTPGLNSIQPEHAEVARGFIGRADAVVWVFTAGQAGKASERAALATIRSEGKRVLGVLNKIDQVNPTELGEVLAHVRGGLGDLIEEVVPASIRRALAARAAGTAAEPTAEPATAADGNWLSVTRALEQRFFVHARELKRQACDRRVAALLVQATARVAEQEGRLSDAAAALSEAATDARAAAERFEREVATVERRALAERAAQVYRSAARDVLELVRPRARAFGSHSASEADRDYLVSLLETGLAQALEPARIAVAAELRRTAQALIQRLAPDRATPPVDEAARDVERVLEDTLRLADAEVFGRGRAFVRGYLRGGGVDDFVRRVLPKLDLVEDNIYHALVRDAPDLDREVGFPLATTGRRALLGVAELLERAAGRLDAMIFDLEHGLRRALAAADDVRREVLA